MGLKGNLSTVNLADVFQVLSRGNSTGLLRIQAPDGPRFVEIQNGAISIAGRNAERIMLGDLLISRGLLDEEKLEKALTAQKETGKLLGQVLIDLQLINLEQLEEALRFQVEEEVCELFLLRSGDFDFLAGASLDAKIAPGGGLVRMKIDPNGLLIEAARRSDEWKAIEQRIANQNYLFQLTGMGQQVLHSGEGISPEGAILLKLVLGQRTVEAMIQKACLGRLTTNQMLLELWDAGMIEPMPFSNYEKVAREHLRLRRVEEAERIASFAAEAAEPEQKERAQLILADVEKARKIMSQASSVKVTVDPKVRSEVIRRNQPNLILKKERSSWPLVIGLGLVGLCAAGAAIYLLLLGDKKGSADVQKRPDFRELQAAATALKLEKKFVEAKNLLEGFITHDPELKKAVNELATKVQQESEHSLSSTIKRFYEVYPDGKPAEIKVAAEELEHYRKLPVLEAALLKEKGEALKRLDRYHAQQAAGADRQAWAALKTSTKKAEAREEEWLAFFRKNSADELVNEVGEEIRKLQFARIDAKRLAAEAREMLRKRDLQSAEVLLESATQIYPNSQQADDLAKELAAVKNALGEAQAQWTKLEATRPGDARTALIAYLDSQPPQHLASRALARLHTLTAEVDGELQAALRQLVSLPQAEARPKIIQWLAQHKYAKCAKDLKLKVNLTSEPAGADVEVNGQASGKTPGLVPVPVLDRISVTFKKAGFVPCEFNDFDFRGDSIAVILNRLSTAARRLQVPAHAGMLVADEHVVLGGGSLLAIYARELKLVYSLRLPAELRRSARALCASAGYVFVALDDRLLRIKIPAGEPQSLALAQAPAGQPAVFGTTLGVPTKNGLETFSTEDFKPTQALKLDDDLKPLPQASTHDDKHLYLACGKTVVALNGAKATLAWKTTLAAEISGRLAVHKASARVAAMDAAGKLSVCDATGVKFQHDFGKAAHSGVVALSGGFLVAFVDGSLALCAATEDKILWSSKVAGQPVLPAEAAGDKLVICSADAADNYVYLLDPEQGTVLWRALLYAKAVNVASDGKRLLVSTEDGEVTTFDL